MKKEIEKKPLDMKGMRGRFEFVKENTSTNLKSNEKIPKIREDIEYHVQKLPHTTEILPKIWVAIRSELEHIAKERDYILIEEYLSICANYGISEEIRALYLSSYLHDLGTFLHFQDGSLLQNIFILNNAWATDAVYKIIDNEKVAKQLGNFDKEDLNKIWNEPKYKYKHNELLALMTKFELCFSLGDNKWLAPQLLPVEAPSFNWAYNFNLIVKYTYDFMPKGLLSRLIVRKNVYVSDKSMAWRGGVILERQKTKALITQTYGSEEIIIRVTGYYPKELMTIITEDFELMHSAFSSLKFKKLVPCNCQVCKAQRDPCFYEYSDLINRIERKKKTIECNISLEDVNVIDVLNGVYSESKSKYSSLIKIFISYSKLDMIDKNELLTHLSPLRRNNNVITWSDSDIIPSEDWDQRIRTEINEANIFLLLVSANFINTNYIWERELTQVYERVDNNEKVRVIPVIIKDCAWENLPFSKFQALPKKGTPVNSSTFKNKDEAWKIVVSEIEATAKELTELRSNF